MKMYGVYEYFPNENGDIDKVLIWSFTSMAKANSIKNFIQDGELALIGVEEIDETAT